MNSRIKNILIIVLLILLIVVSIFLGLEIFKNIKLANSSSSKDNTDKDDNKAGINTLHTAFLDENQIYDLNNNKLERKLDSIYLSGDGFIIPTLNKNSELNLTMRKMDGIEAIIPNIEEVKFEWERAYKIGGIYDKIVSVYSEFNVKIENKLCSMLYVLTEKGDVYSVDMDKLYDGNLMAMKVLEGKNIQRLVGAMFVQGEDQGMLYSVVAIDIDNKSYELDNLAF